MPTFGTLLRATREQSGKTMGDLARHMGWSVVFVSNLELDKAMAPSEREMRRMAEFIGVDQQFFITEARKHRFSQMQQR